MTFLSKKNTYTKYITRIGPVNLETEAGEGTEENEFNNEHRFISDHDDVCVL